MTMTRGGPSGTPPSGGSVADGGAGAQPPQEVRGRVSVVVASYNHAEYLPRRMESLLALTYPDLEFLVVDDRSTDGSVEVLQRYASDPRVRVIVREKNCGWIATYDFGRRLCSGEFVMFANCDDDCDPRLVERLVDALRATPSAGLAFSRSVFIDEAGRTIGDDFSTRDAAFRARCASDTAVTGAEMSRFLLHSCVIPNLSAALMRRACFDVAGPMTTAFPTCSDWEFFFRLARHYDFGYVAEPLNFFRQHDTTIRSTTKLGATLSEYLRLLLGEIASLDLTWRERAGARFRAMSLWACHVIAPGLQGLRDIPRHVAVVAGHDPLALVFLPFAVVHRVGQVLQKACRRVAGPASVPSQQA